MVASVNLISIAAFELELFKCNNDDGLFVPIPILLVLPLITKQSVPSILGELLNLKYLLVVSLPWIYIDHPKLFATSNENPALFAVEPAILVAITEELLAVLLGL